MAYSGKWKRTSVENHMELLTHVGVPKDVIQKMKETEGILEIKQDGGTFDEVLTFGDRVRKSVLVVGKSSQLHTWNDVAVEVVPVEVETNKIKLEFDHDGIHHVVVRELSGDNQFVDNVNLDNGKVIGKFIYTKC